MNFEIGGTMLGGGISTEPIPLPTSFVCGQLTSPHWIMSVNSSIHFNVMFQATGFYQLTGMEVSQYENRILELDNMGEEWAELSRTVHQAQTDQDRIGLLTSFFLQRIPRTCVTSPPSIPQRVLEMIRRDHRYTLSDIASSIGYGERHIRRVFKKMVGISPKKYQQIMRIHSVIHLLRNKPSLSIQDIVAICDFSDAAHLSRQFKRYTGKTINVYLQSQPGLREKWMIWT